MSEVVLPGNVYRLCQARFDDIPGSPLVYWIAPRLRRLFETLPELGKIARPVAGLRTSDNSRFLRMWWELGKERIGFNSPSRASAHLLGKKWFPYMKGGAYKRWFGNQQFIVNWQNDGEEMGEAIIHAYPYLQRPWLGGIEFYYRPGVTWTDLGASGFSARINPGGFVFDVSGSCAFPDAPESIPQLLAVLNSSASSYILGLLNPTMHFQVGDLSRLPLPRATSSAVDNLVARAIGHARGESACDETTYDFAAPVAWDTGLESEAARQNRLAALEAQIDDEIYELYGIGPDDRAAIEAELAGGYLVEGEDENAESLAEEEGAAGDAQGTMSREELAVRWLSYAMGIVLGRFRPGLEGVLGGAVYRPADFAVGSLPALEEAEFDELLGPPERFAYMDEDGRRHVFSREAEKRIRELAVPDGIALLDEGHPSDLAALVEHAVGLMLGDEAAREVVDIVAAGDLRKFISKDFFIKWHFKMYRKRPIYWPIQSAKRSYGFVIFHEGIGKDTFYRLQREFLDPKRRGIDLELEDLHAQLEAAQGRARKAIEKQIAEKSELAEELAQFAADLEAITSGGYEPEPNWIDDGVILRMAPLWKVIPIWQAEPKKHWERLESGEFDWSHIAMRYSPDRVREKCKTNKSYAIAHGAKDL